ncbi:hypothetical protein NKG94_30210 [Micromonospora sp. M12]
MPTLGAARRPVRLRPGRQRAELAARPAVWQALSVTAQTDVPGSTLELYRAALRIRHDHPRWPATPARSPGWRASRGAGLRPHRPRPS